MKNFFIEHSEYFDSIGKHDFADLTAKEAFISIQDKMQKISQNSFWNSNYNPLGPNFLINQNDTPSQMANQATQYGLAGAMVPSSAISTGVNEQLKLTNQIRQTLSELGVSAGSNRLLEEKLLKSGKQWPSTLYAYLKKINLDGQAETLAKKFPIRGTAINTGKNILKNIWKGPKRALLDTGVESLKKSKATQAGEQLAEKATKAMGGDLKPLQKINPTTHTPIPSAKITAPEVLGFATGTLQGIQGQEQTTGGMFGSALKTTGKDALIGTGLGATGGAIGGALAGTGATAGAIAGATAALPAAALAGAGYLAGRTGAEAYRAYQESQQAKMNEAQANRTQESFQEVTKIKQDLQTTMNQIQQTEQQIALNKDPNLNTQLQQNLKGLYQDYYNKVKQVQQIRQKNNLYSRQQWTPQQEQNWLNWVKSKGINLQTGAQQ